MLGLVFAVSLMGLDRLQISIELRILVSTITALVIVGIQFLIGPALIDWIIKTRWTVPAEVGIPFNDWLNQTCAQFRIPVPRFGIIDDLSPNAFTYGHGAHNARVVVTQGLIEALDEDEFRAVVAHELGHIKHRDFIFMTLVQALVLVLYVLYRTTLRERQGGAWGIALAISAYLAYQLSYYLSLVISRYREYMADFASAQIMQSGNPLATGLVKVAYGLANVSGNAVPNPTPAYSLHGGGQASPIAVAKPATPAAPMEPVATRSAYDYDNVKPVNLKTLDDRSVGVDAALMAKLSAVERESRRRMGEIYDADPMDHGIGAKSNPEPVATFKQLGAFGIASAASAQTAMTWLGPAGAIDPDHLVNSTRWELFNPWAKIAEAFSTHPLPARRIMALQELNLRFGVQNAFDFRKVRPAKYHGLAKDLLLVATPWVLAIGLGVGLHLSPKTSAAPAVIGGVLAGWAIGQLIRLVACYPGEFRRSKVDLLVNEVNVSHMSPIPVVMQGTIVGRAMAGVPWASDLIMQDETGLIVLNLRQPSWIIDAIWGYFAAESQVGKPATIYGWYRRFQGPYIEVSRLELDNGMFQPDGSFMRTGKPNVLRAWWRPAMLILNILVIAFGAFLVVSASQLMHGMR